MLNLNDQPTFSKVDTQNLMGEIEQLPEQLAAAWALGQKLPLPDCSHLNHIVIAGVGSSAIGAELLLAYIQPKSQLPVEVVRNYTLPAWANGPETLVICLSYTGNTEEVLSVFEQARANGCQVLTISTGGSLADEAVKAGVTNWIFEHEGLVGSAVGYAFGLPLAVFAQLDLIADPSKELNDAISALRTQQESLRVDVPIMENEAKRLAGQCVGRSVMVLGADHLSPVARYWKIQLNEIAKTWAQFEELPEADHNTLMGVQNPKNIVPHTMLLFLRARDCHPRNQLRADITKEFFMLEGLGTDFFNAAGDTILAQMWTALHFGDYLAYYLAISYEVDPGPVDAVDGLKAYLKEV
jgi:glucose/mannose-6-phosphate isomerase